MAENTKIDVKSNEKHSTVVSKTTSSRSATISELLEGSEPLDWLLMTTGILGGIGTGACLPIFCILLGQLLDNLNKGSGIKDAVNNICLIFIYLAIGNIISGTAQVIGWTYAGER